ncbi:sialidase family protein [Kordiimonas aestuarii]|uniref:sialidase family protein n=1 Tax=Kordiimonas aestuarii TaxID=1005925 RepID=UPI0021D0850A|nr:sialidase family protein [Kordiimonas aestuarii]
MAARQLRAGIMVALALLTGAAKSMLACADEPLLTIAPGLFDESQPDTLGLAAAPGAETFTVFAPREGENHYNHGAVPIQFKGRLYVMWQSSMRDEDAPDTQVILSATTDPSHWPGPKVLAPARPGTLVTSGGWWTDGATLVAFINVWPGWESGIREGYTEYRLSTDGEVWSEPARALGTDGAPVKGVIEQDPHLVTGGRIIGAFHASPGLVATPYYTDQPLAISGWTPGKMENLPSDGPVSRELEPSLYERPDGAVVMIFRDQASSFKTLASISHDRGATWSRPALSPFPDASTKQSAGTLPDGTVFRASNPNSHKARFPLVLSLSSDGRRFDRAFLLRAGGPDMQPMRHAGKYKRPSYSYPKSTVANGWLYVAYATNKEDVEVTRIPWRKVVSD